MAIGEIVHGKVILNEKIEKVDKHVTLLLGASFQMDPLSDFAMELFERIQICTFGGGRHSSKLFWYSA